MIYYIILHLAGESPAARNIKKIKRDEKKKKLRRKERKKERVDL
jgi:hypothetical protein